MLTDLCGMVAILLERRIAAHKRDDECEAAACFELRGQMTKIVEPQIHLIVCPRHRVKQEQLRTPILRRHAFVNLHYAVLSGTQGKTAHSIAPFGLR